MKIKEKELLKQFEQSRQRCKLEMKIRCKLAVRQFFANSKKTKKDVLIEKSLITLINSLD